jgi:hypothetical protein
MAPWLIAVALWLVADVVIVVALARMSGVRSVSALLRSRGRARAARGPVRQDPAAPRPEPVPRLRSVS